MDFNAFRQAVAAQAAALQIADYELYYQREESTGVSAFQHEIAKFSDDNVGGVCLRCLVNGHMGYASTEALSEEGARALVRRAADNAAVLESDEAEFLVEGGLAYPELPQSDAALPSVGALQQTALDGQDALYAQDGVVDGCSTHLFGVQFHLAIANSRGLELRWDRTIVGLGMGAVIAGDGEMANDYQERLQPLEQLQLRAIAAEAADNARAKLGAEPAPTGAMPVVFSPRAMALLLGAYAGVFSAENAQKGLSLLKGREGEVIASDAVTLIDDPFYAESALPMPFDAEGTPARSKCIIENGTLRTLLHNLRTAAAAGAATTGNAAKAGYQSRVSVQPFTLRLAAGSASEEELLRRAGSGVYIHTLGGLHAGANPISGDFSLQSAGFLIENGQKTKPVHAFTVAGNFFSLLRGVTAVADQPSRPEYPGGIGCTAFVSPSVLVEGLSIAGK